MLFFFERTQPAASRKPPCFIYLSTVNEARSKERSDVTFFASRAKKPLHTRVRTGYHCFISVCVRACVTFDVFSDCERCTRKISTNLISLEAGKYGLTRGMCFLARRLKVVAVGGVMRISWRDFSGAGFSLVFQVTTFSNSYTQSSQRRLGEGAATASQSAHREVVSPPGVPFSVLIPEKYGVIS